MLRCRRVPVVTSVRASRTEKARTPHLRACRAQRGRQRGAARQRIEVSVCIFLSRALRFVRSQELWDACGPECDLDKLKTLLKTPRLRVNQTGPWVRLLRSLAGSSRRSQPLICLSFEPQTKLVVRGPPFRRNEEWRFQGCAPLHRAVFYGHAEAVDLLLAAGADVNITDAVRAETRG